MLVRCSHSVPALRRWLQGRDKAGGVGTDVHVPCSDSSTSPVGGAGIEALVVMEESRARWWHADENTSLVACDCDGWMRQVAAS